MGDSNHDKHGGRVSEFMTCEVLALEAEASLMEGTGKTVVSANSGTVSTRAGQFYFSEVHIFGIPKK